MFHGGNSNLVSFIDYMVGRESGLYFPKCNLHMKRESVSNTTVTVLDTFKGEVWKAVATKATNKVLYQASSAPSTTTVSIQFPGFWEFWGPLLTPILVEFHLHIIPRPEH